MTERKEASDKKEEPVDFVRRKFHIGTFGESFLCRREEGLGGYQDTKRCAWKDDALLIPALKRNPVHGICRTRNPFLRVS